MDQAIWAIVYDLKADARPDYLDWFHIEHIPEKLDRPGYVWAAHYRLTDADPGRRPAAVSGNSYLALFAGASSRVFFDPTLSELRSRQDDLTRSMMGCRASPLAFILAEEWRQEASHKPAWPIVELDILDAPGADEAVGAWCARELASRIAEAYAPAALRKLLVAQGPPQVPAKHAVLQAFDGLATRDRHAAAVAASTATREITPSLKRAPRFPVVGERIWPVM